MKIALRIILWTGAIGLTVFGLLSMFGALDGGGSDAAGRGLSHALGLILAFVGGGAMVALLLVRLWRGWLVIAAVILALPFLLVAALSVAGAFASARNQKQTNDMHSGRTDFSGNPGLLKMAEAISKNDDAGLRAAAKDVPNFQAAGLEGKTLLYFAVDEAMQQPQLVRAVETLLSLGADPNYTNGERNSFALAHSVSGELRLLRTMLDAGGNPNAVDPEGKPIVFGNWQLVYFEKDQKARLNLLLDRGADINSAIPETVHYYAAGQTLLLFRTSMGRGDSGAYTDAIDLLQRGADYKRADAEGMTLAKMLTGHRRAFREEGIAAPPEFEALCDWLKTHGVAIEED